MTQEVLSFIKDTQVIFAVLLVMASSVATLGVAWLNGRYQLKRKRYELRFAAKLHAYNEYMECIHDILVEIRINTFPSVDLLKKYVYHSYRVRLFTNETTSNKIANLMMLISNHTTAKQLDMEIISESIAGEFYFSIDEIAKLLNDDLKSKKP